MASLLTGTWPTIHGARGKGATLTAVRQDVPTAAETLKKGGFDNTLALANCAFMSPLLNLGRGFDVYDSRHAYNREIRRADETVTAALKMMHDHRSESNFLFVHLFDPHLDYDPPGGYETKFTGGRTTPPPPLSMRECRAMQPGRNAPPMKADVNYVKGVYYGEVSFVDAQVGRLVDGLKEMGLYDRTTVAITSDHGEEFWEHGGFEHGHTLYDELIRIPLILKLPGGMQPAKHAVEAQVRHVDVMPTMFDLAEIDQPASFVGKSLVPHVMGQSDDDLIAFAESTLYGSEKLSWRTGRFKYIYDLNPRAKQRGKLFDVQADPGERQDLIEQRPDTAGELYRELGKFQKTIQTQADSMSQPMIKNMSPRAIQSLKSLGYIR